MSPSGRSRSGSGPSGRVVMARTMAGRQAAAAAITSASSTADAAVVQPIPIRSMTGPCTSEPTG